MKHYLTIVCLYTVLLSVQAQDSIAKLTTFTYGGYVKFDALMTNYSNGEVSGDSPINDFVLPNAIPVGVNPSSNNLDFHVKESRFNFGVSTKVKGQDIHGFLELDFLLSSQGDEKVSNSFNPRMRHFFFEWNKFLIGQSWSNFMVVIVPDDLDFAGSLEGLVFVRQPQVRMKLNSWSFSLENPETTIVQYQSNSTEVSEGQILPDVTVKKSFVGKWGALEMAGIYRTLSGQDSTEQYYRAPGYGVTAGGKVLIGQGGDDFRFVTTFGNGLGRYVGANFVAGGVLDSNNEINSIQTVNGYLAYNHFWILNKLSSSFNVGAIKGYHNNGLVGSMVNLSSYSGSVNLKYDIVPEMRFGVEVMHGYREVVGGDFGRYTRVQFTAKYIFGFTDRSVIEK